MICENADYIRTRIDKATSVAQQDKWLRVLSMHLMICPYNCFTDIDIHEVIDKLKPVN